MGMSKQLKVGEVVDLIKNNQAIIFIADLCLALQISKQTLYNYFPAGSDELSEISNALGHNKTALKIAMRQKWYQSDNPTVQIALYKLAADDEEKRALSGQVIDANISAEDKVIKLTLD